MLDDYTRKDTEATVVTEKNSTDPDLDHSISKKRRLTKSKNDSHNDKLTDSCATYNDTRDVSVDTKSSSIEDEENPISIEFRSTNDSRLSSHKSSKQQEPEREVERLITDSQLTRASLASDKTRDTEKVVQYKEKKITSKPRKISSSEESIDDLQPLAQSSVKSIDEVEEMRGARSGVNESWQGEVDQDSPALAFERRTGKLSNVL